MFHDDEPPVSLFSFQDIITSLTGIMIFFLLLLALNIIEMTQKEQEASPVRQELARTKAKNSLLRKQIDDISCDIRDYQKRIRAAQAKDEAALMLEKYRLEKKSQELRSQKRDTEKKLNGKQGKYANLETRNKMLKRKQEELKRGIAANERLAIENEELRKKIEDLRKAIAKRKKELQVTVDSSIQKIPLLIECSQERICIFDSRNKKRQTVLRKSPILAELVNEALESLLTFSSDRYYFIFLLKPSSVNYIPFLRVNVAEKMKNADCGFEPILESEGVPNE